MALQLVVVYACSEVGLCSVVVLSRVDCGSTSRKEADSGRGEVVVARLCDGEACSPHLN